MKIEERTQKFRKLNDLCKIQVFFLKIFFSFVADNRAAKHLVDLVWYTLETVVIMPCIKR